MQTTYTLSFVLCKAPNCLTLNIPHAYNRHGFEATRGLHVQNNFPVGLVKRKFPSLGCAACGKKATGNSQAGINTTKFHVQLEGL